MASHNYQEVAHTSLGILGNIASCLFFLSSAPTVIKILRCKSSGDLSGNLYVFKLFNCMLWALYGLPFVHPHDVWVVLTNSIGCVFASMYIIPYLVYAAGKERLDLLWKLCVVIVSFGAMVVLLVLLDKSQRHRIIVVGIISTIVSSGMHITLLSQCGIAIKLKDQSYLHPTASIAAFMKGAIWSAYALVNFDIFILIPNGVGVLIGVVEAMIVIFLIGDVSRKSDQEEESFQDDKGSRRNSVKLDRQSIDICQGQLEKATPNLCSVSRVSSLLGLPRQGSIVVPIQIDDENVTPSSIPDIPMPSYPQ